MAVPHRSNAPTSLPGLLPKGVIAFPCGGISENPVDKAMRLGMPAQESGLRCSDGIAPFRWSLFPFSPNDARTPLFQFPIQLPGPESRCRVSAFRPVSQTAARPFAVAARCRRVLPCPPRQCSIQYVRLFS